MYRGPVGRLNACLVFLMLNFERVRNRAAFSAIQMTWQPQPEFSKSDYFEGTETLRRLRPFARRRLSTKRPEVVDIRLRKPCLRVRRVLLG